MYRKYRRDGRNATAKSVSDQLNLDKPRHKVTKRLGNKETKPRVRNTRVVNKRGRQRNNNMVTQASLRKMREYDRACELEPVSQVTLDVDNLQTNVVLYDLETAGLHPQHDILQVAAVRVNSTTGDIVDEFNQHCTPTAPVPISASAVNNLYLHQGVLCKKGLDGVMTPLSSLPARIVLNNFVHWLLQVDEEGGSVDRKQVICIGYNNYSFDDHRLLNHGKKLLESTTFMMLRRKVFTADLRNLLNYKGKMGALFLECGGSQERADALHDALEDCRAMVDIMKNSHMSLSMICSGTRSLGSVYDRTTNPLLKAGLITNTVASKLVTKMTCESFLKLTESELTKYLLDSGVSIICVKNCIAKRKQFVKFV